MAMADTTVARVRLTLAVLKQNQFISFQGAPSHSLADVHLTILQKVFGSTATLFGKPQGAYATPTGHTMTQLLV